MTARTRKVICYSTLVLSLLGLFAFTEQAYRLYRALQGNMGPVQRGPLPPGFDQKFRDLDMAAARLREYQVHNLQVVLGGLAGFILLTSFMAYMTRARKPRSGDPVAAPVRLGWLWLVPLIAVPGGLVGLLWIIGTIVERAKAPQVAEGATAPAVAQEKPAQPADPPRQPESPPASPAVTGPHAIELTAADSVSFVGKSSSDFAVYGIRLGMSRKEVEEILKKLPQVRYAIDVVEMNVFEPTPDGRLDEKKRLMNLAWDESGSQLTKIMLDPDFQAHLKGENRRLLSTDMVDEQSPFRRQVLGKADRVVVLADFPSFKETAHFFDAPGIVVTDWNSSTGRRILLTLHRPSRAPGQDSRDK